MPVVYRLYQQRPVALTQMIVAFERAMADLPFAILMANETTVDFAFHRQPRQLIRRERIHKVAKPTF